MKKIALPLLYLLAVACSPDTDTTFEENKETGAVSIVANQQFQVSEHSPSGTVIGQIAVSNTDNQLLTYSLESDADIRINEDTGQLTIGESLKLDFEDVENLTVAISVFDGTAIINADIQINIDNIDEYDALTELQKDIVEQFKFLTLFEAQTSPTQQIMRKWNEPMTLFLDGTISASFKTSVENVINEYNEIMSSGDFSISLVETEDEANTVLFFGEKSEVEAVFPEMYEDIKDLTVSGYARGSFQGNFYNSAQIWISNATDALFKHEMGHALGLGHSEFCDSPNPSVMCSTITPGSDFLTVEKDAISYFYHADMPSGLNAGEIDFNAANLILLEDH